MKYAFALIMLAAAAFAAPATRNDALRRDESVTIDCSECEG